MTPYLLNGCGQTYKIMARNENDALSRCEAYAFERGTIATVYTLTPDGAVWLGVFDGSKPGAVAKPAPVKTAKPPVVEEPAVPPGAKVLRSGMIEKPPKEERTLFDKLCDEEE